MRESCNEVLGGARALLLHALASEGVYLDGSTLVATTLSAKHNLNNQGTGLGAGAGSGSGSGSGGDHASSPHDDDYTLSTMASLLSSSATSCTSPSFLCNVPSPRLFRRAEAVRQYMQDELADLLHDVVST